MLLQKVIKEYLLECQIRNMTEKTLKGYRNTLQFFARYLQEYQEVDDLDDVSIPLIKQFIIWEDKSGKKATFTWNPTVRN